MEAHQRGGWRRLSIIHMTISPEICSPQHPICVASRRIRHTTCFGLEPKIRTSSLRRNPDRMECAKHNIWIGGVRSAEEGSWAVKLTFISHVPGTPSASSKQWFMTILPRCHDLTAQLTLTVQKELQISAIKVGITADQLRTAFSAPPAIAGGVLLLVPSPVSMSPSDEE